MTSNYRHSTQNWNSEVVNAIKTSLRTCQETHSICKTVSKPSPDSNLDSSRGPRRLLHLGADSRDSTGSKLPDFADDMRRVFSVRVVEVDVDIVHCPYITLSHCWGRSAYGHHPSGLTLRRKNLRDFSRRIPAATLDHPHAKTFRDAMQVVLDLGFSYLWIDALCIIQDDASDRFQEVAKMDTIYQRGLLNIAATGGYDGRDGLFLDEKSAFMYQPAEFPRYPAGSRNHFTKADPQEYFVAFLESDPRRSENQDPLNKRGWVLQECLLSGRVLSFCRENIYWYCNAQQTCTTASDDFFTEVRRRDTHSIRMPRLPRQWAQLEAGLQHDTSLQGQRPDVMDTDMDSLIAAWQEVVQFYTPTKVSYGGDRIIALSALARNFYCITHPFNNYVAGIWDWKGVRNRQVLWRSDLSESDDVLQQQHQSFAELPSWSPLRHRARIAYDETGPDEEPEWRAHVVEMETIGQFRGNFGAIKGGRLVLRGPLFARIAGQPATAVLWTPDGRAPEVYRHDEHHPRYLMVLRSAAPLAEESEPAPLRGLVLEKKGQARGQYLRVGYFSVESASSSVGDMFWTGPFSVITRLEESEYIACAEGIYIIEII